MPQFVAPELARETLQRAGYKHTGGEWQAPDEKPGVTTTMTVWKTEPSLALASQSKPPIILVEITDAEGLGRMALYRMIEPETTLEGNND